MMFMRSADNLATSAIMLELIEWLISTSPGGNITFIFNKLEEVRQVSATGIAKRKHTMSEPIDQNTFIIILEAASVEPTPLSEAVHKKMTYTDGPVIRVSDGDIVYQQSDKTNQAEHLALNAAANARLEIQHGPLTNNCNSTPHILFGNTPHVIGVTIPCEHKHNFTNEGTFEHEAIRISDLHTTTKLLQQMITDIDAPIKRNTSALLEQIYPVYRLDPQSLTSKRKLWSQSYAWALPRLQSGQLFPTNQLSATRLRLKHIKASIQSR
jgi:putative aminopeptidase FrvX